MQKIKKLFFLFFLYNYSLSNENISPNKSFNKENYNSTLQHHSIKYNSIISNKKNVILGIIQRFSLYQILPFFKSYIHANFTNCDVVMFVRDISEMIISYLRSINVIVYEIPEKYKNIYVLNIRWKMYVDFLKGNRNKYNLVLEADVRDTIFQQDIFKYYENFTSFLGLAIEDGTLNENTNKKWIINLAGVEKHKTIQNERIICFGTLWGTLDKFLEFSIIFFEKLMSNPKVIDQGVGNYLFYYEKIMSQNLILKSDNYGPVMTIALTNRQNIVLDSHDNILNFRGEIPAVIHQYNRKPDIMMKVKNKFCPELLYIKKEIDDNNEVNMIQIKNIKKKYKSIIYFLILLQLFFIIFFFKFIKLSFKYIK